MARQKRLTLRERADLGRVSAIKIDARAEARTRGVYQREISAYRKTVDELVKSIRQAKRMERMFGHTGAVEKIIESNEMQQLLKSRTELAGKMRTVTEREIIKVREEAWGKGLKDAKLLISRAPGDGSRKAERAWRAKIKEPTPAKGTRAFNKISTKKLEAANITKGWEKEATERLQKNISRALAAGEDAADIKRIANGEAAKDVSKAKIQIRSETMRAYRGALRETYKANDDIIRGWIWRSALDETTCAACWAMHGTEHSLDDDLDDHVSGKCIPMPMAVSYEEAGIDAPDTRQNPIPGEERLAMADPDVARKVLGPGAYDAWAAGDIRLSDLVQVKETRAYGKSVARNPNYAARKRASSRASSARARAKKRAK